MGTEGDANEALAPADAINGGKFREKWRSCAKYCCRTRSAAASAMSAAQRRQRRFVAALGVENTS